MLFKAFIFLKRVQIIVICYFLILSLTHIYTHLQVPRWLLKFAPGNTKGVFLQDEVTLVMRQQPEFRDVLRVIEDDEMFIRISQLYESSRLSELSRPAETREIDMEIPGVVELFLGDLMDR